MLRIEKTEYSIITKG